MDKEVNDEDNEIDELKKIWTSDRELKLSTT